jgi:RluA family pseudouridine synthase
MNIEILYEDKDIVAVNKPEGLASISESDINNETLHSFLEKKYLQKMFIVHRIDKEASGIILFAKNPETHKYLNDQFAKRRVKKTYLALVHSKVNDEKGRVDKPIREFGSGRMGVDEKNGKRSITDYKLNKEYKDFSLLHVSIITGRRHQIRVHLYSIGNPIVGDLRYGDRKIQEKFPRLMLHAHEIEIKLPSGKSEYIKAVPPSSFTDFLETIE